MGLAQLKSNSPLSPRCVPASSILCQVDPLTDYRWVEFLQWHPQASIFHTPQWLEALKRTYGYRPIVFTSSREGDKLKEGTAFCIVQSWPLRPRLVSLPFSDHAQPLLADQSSLLRLLNFLEQGKSERKWASVELRPPYSFGLSTNWSNFRDGRRFILHRLELEPSLESLFRHLNKDSTQRKIRRAEREGLQYEEGRSESLLRAFFHLSVLTRRRKSLPPPPFDWFRNLVECLGERAKIRLATTRDRKLAGAVLTLSFKDTMLFKYGASDAKFHRLGTMPYLLWKAIEDAKQTGARLFDFGRSEICNPGLIHFKDNFGATQSSLVHKAFPPRTWEEENSLWMKLAKSVFSNLPESVLVVAGRLLYRHLG